MDNNDQRIAELERKLEDTRQILAQFMSGPYKNQKEFLLRVKPIVELFETNTAPFEAKPKHTRRALNKADWSRVVACLDDDGNAPNWAELSRICGIPQSTARKYAKLSPEDVSKLPAGNVGDVVTETPTD